VIGRRLTLRVLGDFTVGAYTFINNDAHIVSHSQVHIGEHVRVGERVSIHDENHVFEPLPVDKDSRDTYVSAPIHIGDRVWLGANVTILPGVTIGDDSVVAAGSVVTKDVPAAHLAVGNPARIVRPLS
jgi:acetyltransferase-like isoleucine patch superfamily enzyme